MRIVDNHTRVFFSVRNQITDDMLLPPVPGRPTHPASHFQCAQQKTCTFYCCKTVQIIFYFQPSCWNHGVWNCIEPGARQELASNHQTPLWNKQCPDIFIFFKERLLLSKALKMQMQGLFQPHERHIAFTHHAWSLSRTPLPGQTAGLLPLLILLLLLFLLHWPTFPPKGRYLGFGMDHGRVSAKVFKMWLAPSFPFPLARRSMRGKHT